MPEQLLDDLKPHALVDEVGGVGVPPPVGGDGRRAAGLVGDVALRHPDAELLAVGGGLEGLIPVAIHVAARDQSEPGVGQRARRWRGEEGAVLVGVALGDALLLFAELGEQGAVDGDERVPAHLVVPVVDVGVLGVVDDQRVEAESCGVSMRSPVPSMSSVRNRPEGSRQRCRCLWT